MPIAASVLCAALVSAALPRPRDLWPALGWWAVVVATSTTVLVVVDRGARRLLPLALLLRLSLVFPDQAPKRFRVAAQAWSTRRLRLELEAVRANGEQVAPSAAAGHIIGLLGNLAAHDRRTRGHCERVRAYNDLLAEELGLSAEDRDRLRWAALIHDIGKLRVPRRLLNKAGTPTAKEWEALRAHPQRGAEIAAPLAEWLGPWAATIEQHHEHWDGSGYPHGLAGEDISLGARIVGVADAFEVMTSPRPYSRPVSPDAARAELAACAGTHFDPVVVRAFLNVSIGRLRKAMGAVAWFAQVPFLAGVPRLSAALIQGGQQAAVGAGGAIGVAAATTIPAHHGHHHHPVAHAQPRPAAAQQAVPGATPSQNLIPPVVEALRDSRQLSASPAPRPAHRGAAAVAQETGHGNAAGDGKVTAPGQVAEPAQHQAAQHERAGGKTHHDGQVRGTAGRAAPTPRPSRGKADPGECGGAVAAVDHANSSQLRGREGALGARICD